MRGGIDPSCGNQDGSGWLHVSSRGHPLLILTVTFKVNLITLFTTMETGQRTKVIFHGYRVVLELDFGPLTLSLSWVIYDSLECSTCHILFPLLGRIHLNGAEKYYIDCSEIFHGF